MNRLQILTRLTERGIGLTAASVQIGRGQAYMQQFLRRGVPAKLDEDDRAALSRLTGIPDHDLRGEDPQYPEGLPKGFPEGLARPMPAKSVSRRNYQGALISLDNGSQQATQSLGHRDLPVFGTVPGDRGVLTLSSQAVDWVARPSSLERVRDAYGVMVTDDAMSPEFRSGSTVCLHPHLPPREGDACIFRGEGGVVQLRTLRRFDADTWFVSQHNPAKDSRLKRSDYPACHVAVASLFSR